MAKKAAKTAAATRRTKLSASKRGGATKPRSAERKAKPSGRAKASRGSGKRSQESATDALVGLLETPLVNEVLAAGAAAAIATFTHHSLSRKSEGSTTTALKEAATAAAAAMAARLSTEFDEITKNAKKKAKAEEA